MTEEVNREDDWNWTYYKLRIINKSLAGEEAKRPFIVIVVGGSRTNWTVSFLVGRGPDEG